MAVTIKFLGMQRTITNIDSIDMVINGKATVNDALEYVRQQYPTLPLDEGMILMVVNSQVASPNMALKDSDVVSFLPTIGGG